MSGLAPNALTPAKTLILRTCMTGVHRTWSHWTGPVLTESAQKGWGAHRMCSVRHRTGALSHSSRVVADVQLRALNSPDMSGVCLTRAPDMRLAMASLKNIGIRPLGLSNGGVRFDTHLSDAPAVAEKRG
jgi:hypothetical protein